MERAFDLLSERWLGISDLAGATKRSGIHAILLNASRIGAIVDPSPLVQFSALRLLCAIVHWLHPIKSPDDWQTLWQTGQFPEPLTNALLERGADRFDLFDAGRPFYQMPREVSKNDLRPISDLAFEVPTDTNINHFRHAYDDQQAFCPACCARGLIQVPPFCAQGGRPKPPSINGAPPAYLYLTGSNLFETIMLNLPIPKLIPESDSLFPPDDLPAWEGRTAGDGPIGLLEGLTWQPRSVYLLPQGDQPGTCSLCGSQSSMLTRSMVFRAGRSKKKEARRLWIDPHTPMRNKDGKDQPLIAPDPIKRSRSAAGFWRTIIQASYPSGDSESAIQRPIILRQFDALSRICKGKLPPVKVQSVCLHTNQAKCIHWGTSEIDLICDSGVCGKLMNALDLAGNVARHFRPKAKAGRSAKAKDPRFQRFDAFYCQTISNALPQLERQMEDRFRILVAAAVTNPDSIDARIHDWENSLSGLAADNLATASVLAHAPMCHGCYITASARKLAALQQGGNI